MITKVGTAQDGSLNHFGRTADGTPRSYSKPLTKPNCGWNIQFHIRATGTPVTMLGR